MNQYCQWIVSETTNYDVNKIIVKSDSYSPKEIYIK